MAAKSREHRLRMLQHLARLAAAHSVADQSDPQLKMPLIVEVKRGAERKPRTRRTRAVAAKQPGLDGIESSC